MKGLLVRVGIDSTAGGWHGPVDPETGDFVYVPIPEKPERMRSGYERRYAETEPALLRMGMAFPAHIALNSPMHLDPDFENLTYGDCTPRGNPIREMGPGDFLVFFAGLRSMRSPHNLVYAIIGYYEVAEVVAAEDVPKTRWLENAHTRRINAVGDVIVRARPGVSGRLSRCIPIGAYRKRAYRVTNELLAEWGGISAYDGYLQRSAVLPRFLEPQRFMKWFQPSLLGIVNGNG